jgi:hypothetical protein
MAKNMQNLSRLMRISWDIQKRRKKSRSKALTAAWAICTNEDITVQYLTRKLNRGKPIARRVEGQFALFTN